MLLLWSSVSFFGVVKEAWVPTPAKTLGALAAMFHDGNEMFEQRRSEMAALEKELAGADAADKEVWQTRLDDKRAQLEKLKGEKAERPFLDSSFIRDGGASVGRVAKAILLAMLVGIPLGILMGAFGRVEAFLRWVVFPLKTAPIIAFIPIFMLIWGIEETMKVRFLFFGAVVYMIPLTFDAIRAVPEEYVDAAVDYGFGPWGTIRHFLLPAALPRIFEAVKVCVGITWTYLVAAEIVNVTTGLGAVVKRAERFQNTPKVWAGILLILIIGVLTDYALGAIQRRWVNWES